MKIWNYYIRVSSLLLMMCLTMLSCSNDEVLGEEEMLSQDTPLFTDKDFETCVQTEQTEEIYGTWTIVRVNGNICRVLFGDNPSPTPPSEEAFFKNYLKTTEDNVMELYGRDYANNPHYRQKYKGVPVESGSWHFSYHAYGVLGGCSGTFIPIKNLDTTPEISEDLAKAIIENYIKGELSGEFYLAVMQFPHKGILQPRLVYAYKHKMREQGDFIYVDAKTGQLLYHLSYIGGQPYV